MWSVIKLCDQAPSPAVAKPRNLPLAARGFAVGVLLSLLTVLVTPGAESPDEQYVRIYSLIERADSFSRSGEFNSAKSRYEQAQTQLQSLKKNNPIWNPKVVAFRLNYLAERIAAISQSNAPPASAATKPAPKPSPKAPSASVPELVKLLNAGAEPRRVLRLHPKPGDKRRLVMTTKMGMSMSTGGAPGEVVSTPPIQMVMDTTVRDVSADGDIAYELVVADVRLLEEAGVDSQLLKELKASVNGPKGLAITGTMSDRGFNQVIKTGSTLGRNPHAGRLTEELNESLTLVGSPLPAEPVGPGAKWEVSLPLESQGLTINQTAHYQLIAIEGDRLSLTNSIVQGAASQQAEGRRMTGSGNGAVKVDLAQFLPLSATMKSHSESGMGMNTPGQKGAMTLRMEMEIRLEAK